MYALGDGDNEGAHLVFRTTSAAGESEPYGSNTFERLRITSSGFVGINTDAPEVRLHVNESTGDGTARSLAIFQKDHTSGSITGNMASNGYPHALVLENQDTSSDGGLTSLCFSKYTSGSQSQAVIAGISQSPGNMDLTFNVEFNNTIGERLRITSSGIISINRTTTTGNNRLQIYGNNNDEAFVRLKRINGAGDDSAYGGINVVDNNDVTIGSAEFRNQDSTTRSQFVLSTYDNNGSGLSEAIRVKGNGNVGINRTSPNSKLHIGSGNLQVGDFSTDTYETKLGSNALTFKRNADSFIDQLGTGTIHFRLGSSNTSVLKLQDSAEAVKVIGEAALTGTTGGAKGLTLQTSGGSSCPLYFGSETHSAQKSMYLNGYWIYLRGHQNEGIRFIFSQSSGNAPRSDQYQFKYNSAYRPTGNTTWDGFSDRRAKENIQDVTSALDTIGRLRPVTFDWTNDYADRMNMFNLDKTDPRSYMWTSVKENGYDETRKNNNVGFIAQEFEEVFPNDITETEMQLGDETISDFKTVNFDSLIPMLTKAVQELKSENDSLRARLDAAGL